ncbi:capsule assembly Wzi family protein [Neiella marina]|uniref:Capsule assembly Wzi family protein n=1 Tax=Neiella holothuriorum TaxID=2870530 RepID=A0ABS7EG19_9GAMM|nr:capsule assembly Wzi family protein [Neiella holothuriorum]MBW8191220.1 capsule assembly Wzi family protein [Neiella holothuriorum]
MGLSDKLSATIGLFALTATTLVALPAQAKSVSPYLPLKLSPEIEYKVERLFVLADEPIIKRPLAVRSVYKALAKIGDQDPALSRSIKRYLGRYNHTAGLTHGSAKLTIDDDVDKHLANARGRTVGSSYEVHAGAYWTPTDSMWITLGGLHSDDTSSWEGSYVSFGDEWLQIDIGYRPHWFGPFQDSDMLIATNAETMPSVTLSNTVPLTDFGFTYELFLAQMSESDLVLSQERDEYQTGEPRLFGVHFGFQPFDGFAIAFNRLMQYGGGDRDEDFSSLFKAFVDPSGQDNIGQKGRDFGNQLSSVTTRYTFPGEFPFSVYMEYAGEDTSNSSNFRLGNTALMFGFHLPKLTKTLDLTYEFADWQNAWYVNSNYGDGLRNEDVVIGHWGGQNRDLNPPVGATTHMAKLIWEMSGRQILTSTARFISNEDYYNSDYDDGYELHLEYTHIFSKFLAGAEIYAGQNVYGDSFATATGFIRW